MRVPSHKDDGVIQKPPRTRQIVAAVIGNALEWYDFVVYGFLTVIIARLFFPAQSEYASLLLTMATFGVGFFMRPVGGIVLGMYADRKGRKAALQLIIGLMTLAMAMIAFAPPYAAIGIAAPLIILLARLLQGFSAGGEFASATAFLVETAPPDRRGFYGSLQMVGQSLAALSAAVAGTLITRGLDAEQIDSWGWRLPFLFGLIIGPVGLYIRRYLEETDAFLDSRRTGAVRNPFGTVFVQNKRSLAVTFGLVICGTISYYVVLVYMPTFAKTQLGMPLTDAFVAQVIGLVCLTATIPLCGALSDRIGRRPILVAATIAYFILLYPLFDWVYASPSLFRLAIMQGILCTLVGVFFGPISTAIAEQFPTGVRSTGLAIAYNFAVMLFGGFAQFVVTWLIREIGSPIAPAYYVMFGAVVGFVASISLVERYRDQQLPNVV
jgi:MHS family proline/betaine transporter-like MFS transporter